LKQKSNRNLKIRNWKDNTNEIVTNHKLRRMNEQRRGERNGVRLKKTNRSKQEKELNLKKIIFGFSLENERETDIVWELGSNMKTNKRRTQQNRDRNGIANPKNWGKMQNTKWNHKTES
jgi:hypothetical protein